MAAPDSQSPSVDPRLRILAAAGNEFAAGGYESATVRDICAAAAVNVAAVNYYFGDKRRLSSRPCGMPMRISCGRCRGPNGRRARRPW